MNITQPLNSSLSLIGNSYTLSSNNIDNTYLSNGNHIIEGNYLKKTILEENTEISGNGFIQNLEIGGNNSQISPDLVPLSYLPSDILQIQNFTSSFDSELNILINSTGYSRLIIEPYDNISGRIFINVDYISSDDVALIPDTIYYPIYSINEDLESKELFYVREPDNNNEILVANCSVVSNNDDENFRVFFSSSSGLGTSAILLKVNNPPEIQNLVCDRTCERNIDCTCCTNFVSSIVDPDISECSETFTIVDSQSGLFVDSQDSSMICFTESSIQGSIQESINYQVKDTGGDLSNIAMIFFNFNVPSLSPSISGTISPTASPTSSKSPSSSLTGTPSISSTRTISKSPTISSSSSNTQSTSNSLSITPKESLILVRPTYNPIQSSIFQPSQTKPSVSINNQMPSISSSRTPLPFPTSAGDGDCANCITGNVRSPLSTDNQNIQLISDDRNIGVLIIPSTIAPQGTIDVSYVSNLQIDTNDVTLGSTIFDITITDEFGLSVTQFSDSLTICFEEEEDINVCIIFV